MRLNTDYSILELNGWLLRGNATAVYDVKYCDDILILRNEYYIFK